MTNQNSGTGVAARCQFPFSDGRCGRMLQSPDHSSCCAFHARQELQLLESQRLGAKISASLNGNFLTATDINHVLGKFFVAVAQDRIPLRKAAILTYLGQVMLSSLPYMKKEFPFAYKFDYWNKVLGDAAPLSDPPSLTYSSPESPPAAPRTQLPRRRMTVNGRWAPNRDSNLPKPGFWGVRWHLSHNRCQALSVIPERNGRFFTRCTGCLYTLG